MSTSFVLRARDVVYVLYLLFRLVSCKEHCKWCRLPRDSTEAGAQKSGYWFISVLSWRQFVSAVHAM